MKCNDTSRLIINKLAGELSPSQASKLDKHLSTCDTCRKEFKELSKVWQFSDKTLKADTFVKELTPVRRSEIFAAAQYEAKRQKSSRIVTRVVEYFAVIAICFILAGMMLPALNQSREKARRISAQSRIKQAKLLEMQKAMDKEVADNDDETEGDEIGNERTVIAECHWRIPSVGKSKKYRKTLATPASTRVSSKLASSTEIKDTFAAGRSNSLKPQVTKIVCDKIALKDGKKAKTEISTIAVSEYRIKEKESSFKRLAETKKISRSEMNSKADISAPRNAPLLLRSRTITIEENIPKKQNILLGKKCKSAPALQLKAFTLNLKLWNMTTVSNVRKYLKENNYPVPNNIKVYKTKNMIIIRAPKTMLEKIDKLFRKLEQEEKELKDLSKGLPFIKCLSRPFSTFSIDTDTASYVQARKSIMRGERPNPLKIRPEEFINYFDYNYRSPQNATFAVYPEAAPSPFRPNNTLFRIGIQGKRLGPNANTRTHYTILLDTSGSMAVKDRMELAKKALAMLVKKLKSSDYVSLLLCGSKTKVVFYIKALTPNNRQRLLNILNKVTPRGVADFAKGISKAYSFADRHYVLSGSSSITNRIIIISDGIFELNAIGRQNITSQIETARKRGISNIVIGLGGDGDDNMLEKVASSGDGSYVFLDTEREAKELFSTQFEARFREIARDVKIQVQFNPDAIKSYRQIGYKNRQLSKADFRNDKVDAGEVGSGQAVTALYELNLKDNIPKDTIVATVRIRYKKAGDMSVEEKAFYLSESDIKEKFKASSANFKLAAFVAEFAESLRYPETQGIASLRGVADKLTNTWMKHYRKDHKVTGLLSLIKRSK